MFSINTLMTMLLSSGNLLVVLLPSVCVTKASPQLIMQNSYQLVHYKSQFTDPNMNVLLNVYFG